MAAKGCANGEAKREVEMNSYFGGQKAGRMLFLLGMTTLLLFVDAATGDKSIVLVYMAVLFVAIAMAPTKWLGWSQLPYLIPKLIPAAVAVVAAQYMLVQAGGYGVASALALGMAGAGAIGGALVILPSPPPLMGLISRYWSGQ